jgi:hypothetical protein
MVGLYLTQRRKDAEEKQEKKINHGEHRGHEDEE